MVLWLSGVAVPQQGWCGSGKQCVDNGAYQQGTSGTGTGLLVMPWKRVLTGWVRSTWCSKGSAGFRLVLSHLGRVFPLQEHPRCQCGDPGGQVKKEEDWEMPPGSGTSPGPIPHRETVKLCSWSRLL